MAQQKINLALLFFGAHIETDQSGTIFFEPDGIFKSRFLKIFTSSRFASQLKILCKIIPEFF
jgi:hypothetical protein